MGNSSARVTYQIGQDSQHNGTAVFDAGGNEFLNGNLEFVNVLGDAGDGRMHFQVINSTGAGQIGVSPSDSAVGSSFRIAYINFGSSPYTIWLQSAINTEIDHNYFFKLSQNANSEFNQGIYCASTSATTWGQNLLHHNQFFIPRSGEYGDYGDDGVDGYNVGADIFNNLIYAYYTNYDGAQHQDGTQPLWGQYIRVYNNVFVNMANSCVFPEPVFGDISDYYVFNNICICDNASIAGSPMRGVDINSGWSTPNGYGYYNVVVANNLFADIGYPGNAGAFACRLDDNIFSFTGCLCANNVSINANGGYDFNAAVANAANIGDLIGAASSGLFASYTAFAGTNNDFHLAATADSLIGQGINLSSYFTADLDGNTRPATGNWDIGPYQYSANAGLPSTNPVIRVSPPTLSFNCTPSGQTATGTCTVQNIGQGTLTGTASVPGPYFSVVSGGTYSLTHGQSQVVQIAYHPGGAALDRQTVTFTGGSGATLSASGYTSLGTNFAASGGTLTAPYVASNSFISQPVNTTVANGGTATFCFAVPFAGLYTLSATVFAPSETYDSLYLNIDAQPTDPADIWDIPVFGVYTTQVVSWRGNGHDGADQFVPQIFNLSAGAHQLILVGRDANVQVGQITITPYFIAQPGPPAPPLNLHIVSE